MLPFWLKVALSALMLTGVSTLARQNAFWAGLLASLPMISVLSLIWLYADTQDPEKIIALSHTIFWMVLPSLSLFVILPVLLRQHWPFPWAMGLACLLTAGCYQLCLWGYARLGIHL